MALVAPIKNGQVVETESQKSLSGATKRNGSEMDKEAFLQLLVAQMQYQDPLEPTSNTEYISQYAQFSQVEAISNMSESMDLTRASSLVGQEVYVRTTGSNGESKYIQGKVDYVVYENGKAYLSINEELYSLADLDTVVDADYMKAYNMASEMTEAVKKLPSPNSVVLSDATTIDALQKTFTEMNDYQRGFVSDETKLKLAECIAALKTLREAADIEDEAADPEELKGTEQA